jgi:hypothetical protein
MQRLYKGFEITQNHFHALNLGTLDGGDGRAEALTTG